LLASGAGVESTAFSFGELETDIDTGSTVWAVFLESVGVTVIVVFPAGVERPDAFPLEAVEAVDADEALLALETCIEK